MQDWQLVPDGEPYSELVRPVRTVDGRAAVLKVAPPHGWRAGSVAALKFWRGEGAVEVLRAKPARGAVLLEPLQPTWAGAYEVAQLWARLHRPAPSSLPRLADLLAAELAAMESVGRSLPLPPRLVEQALRTGRRLLEQDENPISLHGNLRGEHVLLRGSEPVAIAPLGLAGNRHAEAAAFLADAQGGTAQLQEAFWQLVDALVAAGVETDEQQLRDWTVVLSVVRAARPGQPREQVTRLIGLAKAVASLQVDLDL